MSWISKWFINKLTFTRRVLNLKIPSTMSSLPSTGFKSHQESSTTILIPNSATGESGTPEVFINPVQEYNRDLSIAAIRAWSKIRDEEFTSRRAAKLSRSKPNHRSKVDLTKRPREEDRPEKVNEKVESEEVTSKKPRTEETAEEKGTVELTNDTGPIVISTLDVVNPIRLSTLHIHFQI